MVLALLAIAGARAQSPVDTKAFNDQILTADRAYGGDPDYPFVNQVCLACHSPSLWMHEHSWPQWIKTFTAMADNGARGTDEQWDHISNFFQQNLTLVNVNTSPPDEIAATLGIGDEVTAAILAYREKQKFSTGAELVALGVNPERLRKIGPRLSF